MNASIGSQTSVAARIAGAAISAQAQTGGNSSFARVFEKEIAAASFALTIPFSEHNIYSPRDVVAFDSSGNEASLTWSISGRDISIESNIDLDGYTIKVFQ